MLKEWNEKNQINFIIDSPFYGIEDDDYSYINDENEISVNLFKDNNEKNILDINKNLNAKQKKDMFSITEAYKDIVTDKPGNTSLIRHDMSKYGPIMLQSDNTSRYSSKFVKVLLFCIKSCCLILIISFWI